MGVIRGQQQPPVPGEPAWPPGRVAWVSTVRFGKVGVLVLTSYESNRRYEEYSRVSYKRGNGE